MPGTPDQDFQRLQRAFAGHIRDPEHQPAPPVEPRRMAIYRDLFFNNIRGFLSDGFPVLRQLYSEAAWDRLARDFFAHHPCHSPLFLDIPREFVFYVQNERAPAPGDPPFLAELAHYEWVELALSVAEEVPVEAAAAETPDAWLTCIPVASSLAWLLQYRYPVHHIGPDFQPEAPPEQPTHILVYRDAEDQVRFLELNPVSARLFASITAPDNGSTGRGLLQAIATELDHPDPEAVIAFGLELLLDWHDRGILTGVRTP